MVMGEASSTITVKEDNIEVTRINPSSNGINGIDIPVNITQPVIPVNVITNIKEKVEEIKTVSEVDDMGLIIEEVVNKIVNKAVEKMNDDFISHLDSLKLDIDALANAIKGLKIDTSHQVSRNIEVNTRLTLLENKEDKVVNVDIDKCIITKIKSILLSFVNK